MICAIEPVKGIWEDDGDLMKVKYTGSFVAESGTIIVCDPRATAVAEAYYGFGCREDFKRSYELACGTYGVYTNLYADRLDNDRYLCYMSHIALIPECYNGGELRRRGEDVINTGFSRTVCVVDESCYDKPGYSTYGVMKDAVYNIHDILNHGADFRLSNMEPLEQTRREYMSGDEIVKLCGGIPELSDNSIRSTHWGEDIVYRADMAPDTGVIIWRGAACGMSGISSVISTYTDGRDKIVICSVFDTDERSESRDYERRLRAGFIEALQEFYRRELKKDNRQQS